MLRPFQPFRATCPIALGLSAIIEVTQMVRLRQSFTVHWPISVSTFKLKDTHINMYMYVCLYIYIHINARYTVTNKLSVPSQLSSPNRNPTPIRNLGGSGRSQSHEIPASLPIFCEGGPKNLPSKYIPKWLFLVEKMMLNIELWGTTCFRQSLWKDEIS